ncbi:MAG: tagaturonate reductase [Oscillospiraceae bacterium]|nr:tagaturonate reductase [Oscillospiraceae bacterium]
MIVSAKKVNRPIKILQFGEGNFLRAFVEHKIEIANEMGIFDSNVQIVKPVNFGSTKTFKAQGCVYTVLLRGIVGGEQVIHKKVITCVDGISDSYGDYDEFISFASSADLRFVISNTTEAGIVYDENDRFESTPPVSFPGKVTKFLYERYNVFGGAKDKGLIFLPTELISKNGEHLRDCCLKLCKLWGLPDEFKLWIIDANIFCNTLVDRIVTGYPHDEADELEKELGYTDSLLVCGEPFALWVIESTNPTVAKEFPMDKAGLPVIFTDNLQPYRERKVRILNGIHTSCAAAAFLSGLDTVGEMMVDETLRKFLEKIAYGELAPMVPLPHDEVNAFVAQVIERFENPFIRHKLISITLNSISKFKVRVLPTILETFEKTGNVPPLLCFSLASLITFYTDGQRAGKPYEIKDDVSVLEFFAGSTNVDAFLSRTDFWGQDLTKIPGISEAVTASLRSIHEHGMRHAIEEVIA